MRQPFLHDRLQQLVALLADGSAALRACCEDGPGAVDVVVDFLATAAARYRDLGLQLEENEALALTAELRAARRGLLLLTAERVTSRRRDVERTVALRVLTQGLSRLREDVSKDEQRLAAAREQLAPVVVYAVHSGLVATLRDGEDPGSAAEARWRDLCADDTTRQTALHLLTIVSAADVLLVLLDLLNALAPPASVTPRPRSATH